MMYKDCFDAVSSAIKKHMYDKNLRADNEEYDSIENFCRLVEQVFSESENPKFKAWIESNGQKIHIVVNFDFLTSRSPDFRYWDIIEKASSISYSFVDGDTVQTEMVFPSAFVR